MALGARAMDQITFHDIVMVMNGWFGSCWFWVIVVIVTILATFSSK
jgi:hypothetical protein